MRKLEANIAEEPQGNVMNLLMVVEVLQTVFAAGPFPLPSLHLGKRKEKAVDPLVRCRHGVGFRHHEHHPNCVVEIIRADAGANF